SSTQGSQCFFSRLGSAVSSSTPKDFQPNSHKGVSACPVIRRQAVPGPPMAYVAVGTKRASDSEIDLPKRPTNASSMLELVMPSEVRRSLMSPPTVSAPTHQDRDGRTQAQAYLDLARGVESGHDARGALRRHASSPGACAVAVGECQDNEAVRPGRSACLWRPSLHRDSVAARPRLPREV